MAASVRTVATTLLYDSDCGFCRATLGLLLAWDRQGGCGRWRCRARRAPGCCPGLTAEQRLEAARAVPESGIPHTGGAAAPVVLRELPGGTPLAAVAEQASGALNRRGYALVAGNRSMLSRLVPAALLRRADALIARRTAAG